MLNKLLSYTIQKDIMTTLFKTSILTFLLLLVTTGCAKPKPKLAPISDLTN